MNVSKICDANSYWLFTEKIDYCPLQRQYENPRLTRRKTVTLIGELQAQIARRINENF